jgi:rubredoxin
VYLNESLYSHGCKQVEPVRFQYIEEKIMDNYVCKKCGYVYEPAEGDSEAGIEPGLPFASLPEDWHCPQCNAERSEFDPEQGVMPGMVAPIGE